MFKKGIEGSDYINATWLHGHHKLQEFIIAQHPDQGTKEEFWRMLWDHNAQTIVLLSSLNEEVGDKIRSTNSLVLVTLAGVNFQKNTCT